MSVRVEWMTAPYVATSAVPPGTEAGEHETDAPALIIEADTAVVIEGDLPQLRDLLDRLGRALDHLEGQAP